MRVLDELERWYEAHAPGLETAGLNPGFGRGVGDRLNPSAWVNMESAAWLGELRVWESGEAEMQATRRGADGPELDEHHHLAASADLEGVLARLTALVSSD